MIKNGKQCTNRQSWPVIWRPQCGLGVLDCWCEGVYSLLPIKRLLCSVCVCVCSCGQVQSGSLWVSHSPLIFSISLWFSLSLSNTPYSSWVLRHGCLGCLKRVFRQSLERKHYHQVHWGAWFPWDLWTRNAFRAPLTSPGRCPGQIWCRPVGVQDKDELIFECIDLLADQWTILSAHSTGKELTIVCTFQKLFMKFPLHKLHVNILLNTINMCLYTMPMVQLLFVSIYFYQNTDSGQFHREF